MAEHALPIAQTHFLLKDADGTTVNANIAIWQPLEGEHGDWQCKVAVEGILAPKAISGEDSFQSLCLAIGLARRVVKDYLVSTKRQVIPIDAENDGEADDYFSALFGDLGS